MDLTIQSSQLHVDPWLEEFIRHTVLFATWHHEQPIARVLVCLRREGTDLVRCELLAFKATGDVVGVAASNPQTFEAIQIAADRLEVALFGPSVHSTRWRGRTRVAA